MRWEETLLCRKTAKSSLPDFILYLYVPFVVHWMKNGMKESPEDLIEKLSLTIQGNIRSAMERFAK